MAEFSGYEAMRMQPENWKLGCIYVCPDDPRLVVRNRLFFGWAWNFGNPGVFAAIPFVVLLVLGLPYLAYQRGVTSVWQLWAIAVSCLVVVVFWANHNSRDPADSAPPE